MDSRKSFQTLADFGRALLTKPLLHDGLPLITQYAKELCMAQRASVFVRNFTNHTLWTTLSDGIETITLHENDGIAGLTLKEGKPLLINEPYKNEHFLSLVDNKSGFVTQNIASIPVFDSSRKIIGVFQLLNKEGGFTAEDSKFMIFFAHYISTYLELALSYDNQGTLLKKDTYGY